MGVKGLFTIINTHALKSIEEKHMSDYRGTVQGIDASLILYKYCLARTGTYNDKAIGGKNNCHLDTCLHKTCTMLKYGIMPLWIFDGKFPDIKASTIHKRKLIREDALNKLNDPKLSDADRIKYSKLATNLSRSNIIDVKKLLQLMGIQYIESSEEADSQCAALNVANITNGVISEDWDMLLFGCEKLLKNFFNKSNVVEINVKVLLQELNMSLEQLIDLSAVLGNDYGQGIIGIKPLELFKKFRECNYDMYLFLEVIRKEKCGHIPDNFEKIWIESKKYYMNDKFLIKSGQNQIIWNKPNFEDLQKYLTVEKEFDKDIVISKIDELKRMYTYYNIDKKLGPYNVIRRMKCN
jgi:flap endonuclease-1